MNRLGRSPALLSVGNSGSAAIDTEAEDEGGGGHERGEVAHSGARVTRRRTPITMEAATAPAIATRFLPRSRSLIALAPREDLLRGGEFADLLLGEVGELLSDPIREHLVEDACGKLALRVGEGARPK